MNMCGSRVALPSKSINFWWLQRSGAIIFRARIRNPASCVYDIDVESLGLRRGVSATRRRRSEMLTTYELLRPLAGSSRNRISWQASVAPGWSGPISARYS